MYLNVATSLELAKGAAALAVPPGVTAAVFPNTLAFTGVHSILSTTPWRTGAQNVAWVPQGAYTGAISALLFHDAGAQFALVGHSERRYIFGEDSVSTAKKLAACWTAGLTPVLCVGETTEDLAADKRQYRLKQQLTDALTEWTGSEPLIVAYEPVWAIGTDQACSPADADDVGGWIVKFVQDTWQRTVPVLYGGSVNPQNVAAYWNATSLSGVLVGSHATQAAELAQLIQALN